MNRIEFMDRLESLLQDLPKQEREDAIAYYHDYFDDAGVENEQDVIAALGSPEKVAATIKAVQKDEDRNEGEFSETGFNGYDNTSKDEIISKTQAGQENKFSKNNGMLILLIILAVFGFPIWGGLLIGFLGTVFGLLVAFGAVLFSAVVAGFALAVTGVILLVTGIATMFASPISGLAMCGVGMILAGISIGLIVFGVQVLVKAIPAIIRGGVNLLKKLFGKGKTVNG